MRFFAFVLTLFISLAAYSQETQYVSDRLDITLRAGKSNEYRIIRSLISGTPLTVLEVDEEGGYTRVRSPQGDEGWVLTRYLVNEPVARDRLEQAEKQIAKLKEEKTKLQQQFGETSTTKSSLEKEHRALTSENQKLETELNRIRQTAANALTLDSENQAFKQRLVVLERERDVLKQQNEALQDRSSRDWFLAGAAVLFCGMLLGFIIPKMRFKKKSDWGSL